MFRVLTDELNIDLPDYSVTMVTNANFHRDAGYCYVISCVFV